VIDVINARTNPYHALPNQPLLKDKKVTFPCKVLKEVFEFVSHFFVDLSIFFSANMTIQLYDKDND